MTASNGSSDNASYALPREPCGRALLPDAHEPHDYWTDSLSPEWVHCPGDYRKQK